MERDMKRERQKGWRAREVALLARPEQAAQGTLRRRQRAPRAQAKATDAATQPFGRSWSPAPRSPTDPSAIPGSHT